jgi:hypothetical protein
MSTTDATTRPPLTAEDVVADPRPYFRALAVESAKAWLDLPVPPTALQLSGHVEVGRAAVRALLHELEHVDPPPVVAAMSAVQRSINEAGLAQARQALAATRPMCPGGGATIDEDNVDGSYIATCPVCFQHRPAHHVSGRWWAVDGHRARHLAGCLVDGKVEHCICGLDEKIARINAAITEAGHATEAVQS